MWKNYLEKKDTWEPLSAVMHLWKLISIFHKEHLKKLTATFLPLDFASPIARPIILKEQYLKQKRGCLSKKANKRGNN